MSWTGKIIAGMIGTSLGGPIAGVLSAGFAHCLDREVDGYIRAFRRQGSDTWRSYLDEVLISAESLFAGYLARVGEMSPSQADAAFEALAGRRALSRAERDRSLELFREGQRPGFPLDQYVNYVRREIQRRDDLADYLFVNLVYFNGFNGSPSDAQRRAILDIAQRFTMYEKDLSMLERLSAEFRRRSAQGRTSSMDTAAAYATLGIGPDATEAEVRRAYRIQMSRHHPDKLVHQQPSAERLARAAARTDSVRKAYEAIRRARGW